MSGNAESEAQGGRCLGGMKRLAGSNESQDAGGKCRTVAGAQNWRQSSRF